MSLNTAPRQNAQFHVLNNALGVDSADLESAGYLPGGVDEIGYIEHLVSVTLPNLASGLGTLATYHIGSPEDSHGEGVFMRPLTLEDDGSLLFSVETQRKFFLEAASADLSLFATVGKIDEDGMFEDMITAEDFLGDLAVQVNGDPDQVFTGLISGDLLSSQLIGRDGLIASRSGFIGMSAGFLDDTSLQPVPLPAAAWMLLAGIGALRLAGAYKRGSAQG